MKKVNMPALFLLLVLSAWSAQALAAPDTYLGDTAIYSAVDSGNPDRPRPKVLFVIDTSQSTMNKATGVAYDPAKTYEGDLPTWNVYAADNQGNFSTVELAGTTNLANLTCTVAKDGLLAAGTYSGSGTLESPNLKGAACLKAPKGASYALGNYLNYLNLPVVDAVDVIRQNRYTCKLEYTNALGVRKTTLFPITDGCIGTFQLVTSHTASSSSEPGMGSNWKYYWSQTSSGCVASASSFCSDTSLPALATIDPATPLWAVGEKLTAPPIQSTQRQLIYDALRGAVLGNRDAVDFGAMSFNPNNQGADLLYAVSDLRVNSTFDSFDLQIKNAPMINSGTNRPQAESLYDAGHYFGVKYPPSNGSVVVDAEGNLQTTGTLDDTAISSTLAAHYDPLVTRNPCDYNHIILITNGLSNGDGNPLLKGVVDSDGDNWPDESTYGNGSHYADDVAAYLQKKEKITVHSILAFQTEDPLVRNIATQGKGQFHNVYNASGLDEAIRKILVGIVNDVDTSFVAPVVPASSTNRTISSNRVYLGLFKPQNSEPWFGNLKKYGVNSDLLLVDRNNALATYAADDPSDPPRYSKGDFIPTSKSYWGMTTDTNQIMGTKLLPPGTGDGGVVAAGGVGGQLKLDLLAGITRKIYTYPPGATDPDLTSESNWFKTSNAALTTTALGGITEVERTDLITYLHGYDAYDQDGDKDFLELRPWILGDILHSKPLIFNYSSFDMATEEGTAANKTMIFVGANDGMLHAFRDYNGSEAWAFIPPNLLPMLKYLRKSEHSYFSDGAATAYVHDVDGDNIVDSADGDTVVLIFGQRRGGGRNTLTAADPRGAYFALDVTNPEAPKFLWSIDSNGKVPGPSTDDFSELGETWTQPRLAKVRINNQIKVVAFVGAGYDNNEDLRFGNNMKFPDGTTADTDTTVPTNDGGINTSSEGASIPKNPRGRGIYAIEIVTLVFDEVTQLFKAPSFATSGSRVWAYTPTKNANLTYSIPSDITVMDTNNDGFTDRLYVGDTGGRIWRFDVGNIDSGQWTGRILFNANSTTAAADIAKGLGRKFFYRPALTLIDGIPTLYIGSGDREHPLNRGVVDRLYAIKDRTEQWLQLYPTIPYPQVDSDWLIDATTNQLQNMLADSSSTAISDLLYDFQSNPQKFGWFLDLEHAGEKNLSSPLVFNGQAFYTTYGPKPPAELDQCEIGNLGRARLYHVDAVTAEAVYNYNYCDSTDPEIDPSCNNDSAAAYATNERVKGGDGIALTKTYEGGVAKTDDRILSLGEGIPSGITVQLDPSGKASLMISSSNKVGSYSAPDAKMITPLYWLQW